MRRLLDITGCHGAKDYTMMQQMEMLFNAKGRNSPTRVEQRDGKFRNLERLSRPVVAN